MFLSTSSFYDAIFTIGHSLHKASRAIRKKSEVEIAMLYNVNLNSQHVLNVFQQWFVKKSVYFQL